MDASQAEIAGACVEHFGVDGELRPGRAGLGRVGGLWACCVVLLEKGCVPQYVNFAVVHITRRLSENDLGNSGLETLARGLRRLTRLTTL